MGNRICGCRTSRSVVEDRLTRPQRLIQQPYYNIDYRKLRKHILSRKLAPCFDADDESDSDLEECPICFLYFPSLNRSQCCTKEICTECFLQIGLSSSATRVRCPFCKNSNYAVEYCGAKTKEEKALELMEEQKVMEAKLRMQYGNSCGLNHVEPALEAPVPQLEAHCPTEGQRCKVNSVIVGKGSSLILAELLILDR